MFDVTAVGLTLPVWLPIVALVAGGVRIVLGRPVLFRQIRPGLDEREFMLLKFRTMSETCGPDGRLLQDAERLTSFGRFVRSTSLDELPELFSVLRGDMSLVGPRPLLMSYLPYYSTEHRLRHSVLPGITGLAQVSGRNALTWAQRFDLDVYYAKNKSLVLDVKILWRTVKIVLSRKGISAQGEATMSGFSGYETESSLPPHETR